MTSKPELIANLLLAGHSVRMVVGALHLSHSTVQRVRTELLTGGARFQPCPCGRRAGHKGMCSYRLDNLPYPRRPGGRHPKNWEG